MIDKSRPAGQRTAGKRKPAKRHTLPAFTPVPRHYNRHDGWTPERQRGFIEALAETGSVRSAAHAVNMTPEGAYLLRRHEQAGEFRKAWEAALALGVQRLEDVALERALHGVQVPVYCYGKIIGTRTVYNDALLMFMLRNRASKRFAADSLNRADAATRGQLERLKQQWRREWDEERRAADAAEADEMFTEIDARLDLMRTRERARWSAETHRLHDAWQESVRADKALPYCGDEGEEEDG